MILKLTIYLIAIPFSFSIHSHVTKDHFLKQVHNILAEFVSIRKEVGNAEVLKVEVTSIVDLHNRFSKIYSADNDHTNQLSILNSVYAIYDKEISMYPENAPLFFMAKLKSIKP